MFQNIIVSVISVYAHSVDWILCSLISVPNNLREKILSSRRLRNTHIGDGAEDYEDDHGSRGKERILQFWATINMTMRNTLFKKRETRLVIYKSGPSKAKVDCFCSWFSFSTIVKILLDGEKGIFLLQWHANWMERNSPAFVNSLKLDVHPCLPITVSF